MWSVGDKLLRLRFPGIDNRYAIYFWHVPGPPGYDPGFLWGRDRGPIMGCELASLRNRPALVDQFIGTRVVNRLFKPDFLGMLRFLQNQNHVELAMKLYGLAKDEIWYQTDMFYYREMLWMLARNRRAVEARIVWNDLKRDRILFDQHTFGDLIRGFVDCGLPTEAMTIYNEMRCSPEPPLSRPYREIFQGLNPYPEFKEMVKDDFSELFPDLSVDHPPPADDFIDQWLSVFRRDSRP